MPPPVPPQITRRYAEFSAALVGINESFPSERVHRLMAQLQQELESLILRLAAEFRRRKEQLVFLINNYDMMLAVIMVRTQSSRHHGKDGVRDVVWVGARGEAGRDLVTVVQRCVVLRLRFATRWILSKMCVY